MHKCTQSHSSYTTLGSKNSHEIIFKKKPVKLLAWCRESVVSQRKKNRWPLLTLPFICCIVWTTQRLLPVSIPSRSQQGYYVQDFIKTRWCMQDLPNSFKTSIYISYSPCRQGHLPVQQDCNTQPWIQVCHHQPGGKRSNALRCHPPCG